jgi:alkylation response protein AidB-like acyl-CoA dehydrogenase
MTTFNPPPLPSSATTGFFQALPILNPQYTSPSLTSSVPPVEDTAFSRALSLYLPNPIPPIVERQLHDFARKCLDPETLRYGVDAETNPPKLEPLTTFGEENRHDPLWTTEGWRKLKEIGQEGGNVALGYAHSSKNEEWNRRIHQFATVYLFSASAALVTCPAAMTDGCALLLSKHLHDRDGDQLGRSSVLQKAYSKLISFDPQNAWTSGQWMTERTGGSDISLTETVAQRLTSSQESSDMKSFGSDEDAAGMKLGPWRVDGFKWFSSATDADCVILLARTGKGISTFFAPMRRMTADGRSVMNGVRIIRLKDKTGTKALPTAELEIKGMRAWLIGEEGKGVREISAVLNTTRLWTAVGAVAGWARGLAVARAYSRVRKAKNALLADNIQHVAWMANETVKQRASCLFVFFGVALQGVAEQGSSASSSTRAEAILPKEKWEAEILLRALTPVMKSQCSLASVDGLRNCVESLGGVGYCENNGDGGFMNVARIYRDTNVNCIWEGTTSIMAEDLVRALKGKGGEQTVAAVDRLVNGVLGCCRKDFGEEGKAMEVLWRAFKRKFEDTDAAELLYTGRKLLRSLEIILCACLLMFDASDEGDRIAEEVARKYIESTAGIMTARRDEGWRKAAVLDKEIFLGEEPNVQLEGSKL